MLKRGKREEVDGKREGAKHIIHEADITTRVLGIGWYYGRLVTSSGSETWLLLDGGSFPCFWSQPYCTISVPAVQTVIRHVQCASSHA